MDRIRMVLDSPSLSDKAKLAYVNFVAQLPPDSETIWGMFHPHQDYADGLYELARHGLICFEVNGNEYRMRHVHKAKFQ